MITLFSQNNCQPCKAIKRALDQSQTPYVEFNVSEDETARERALSLGYRSAPVTLVERPGQEDEHWQGFVPKRVRLLIDEFGPEDDDDDD